MFYVMLNIKTYVSYIPLVEVIGQKNNTFTEDCFVYIV